MDISGGEKHLKLFLSPCRQHAKERLKEAFKPVDGASSVLTFTVTGCKRSKNQNCVREFREQIHHTKLVRFLWHFDDNPGDEQEQSSI